MSGEPAAWAGSLILVEVAIRGMHTPVAVADVGSPAGRGAVETQPPWGSHVGICCAEGAQCSSQQQREPLRSAHQSTGGQWSLGAGAGRATQAVGAPSVARRGHPKLVAGFRPKARTGERSGVHRPFKVSGGAPSCEPPLCISHVPPVPRAVTRSGLAPKMDLSSIKATITGEEEEPSMCPTMTYKQVRKC